MITGSSDVAAALENWNTGLAPSASGFIPSNASNFLPASCANAVHESNVATESQHADLRMTSPPLGAGEISTSLDEATPPRPSPASRGGSTGFIPLPRGINRAQRD